MRKLEQGHFGIRLPKSLLARLDRAARKELLQRSAYLRRLLDKHLPR